MNLREQDESRRRIISEIRTQCLGSSNEQQTKDEIFIKYKKAAYAVRCLKSMKRTEIVEKIASLSWAVIWSVTCFIYFFTEGMKLITLLTAVPAVGFWIVLVRSAGSISLINMEINELKKEMEKLFPNGIL